MKSLMLSSVLAAAATVAVADPAPRAPDFSAQPARPRIDRSLAASDANNLIEPSTAVSFGFDSASLDSVALAEIDTVGRWLQAHPGQNVVLQGHTDRVGGTAYNLGLSHRRADRVRDRLRSWGVSSDHIIVAVYGKRDAHRRENENDRRVEIFASDRPVAELAASVLSSTPAMEVAWRDNGAQLSEAHNR